MDTQNLRWVCEALIQASKGTGRLYRRWGRKQQHNLFRVYQNFNVYGRFVRIEVWHGSSKAAVIIPEISLNSGWSDIAKKILRFLGEFSKAEPLLPPPPLTKSYRAAASIERWPEISQGANKGEWNEKHPLHRSLVDTFNDPFHHSPNPETIQKWFISRWRVTAGIKVIPLDHNQFLFELPSRQEAIRVQAGNWFWNGRHLSLSWWSHDIFSLQSGNRSENIWLKVFGISLNAWSMDTFEHIGARCGGFIGVDEDTKNRTHLIWARICVKKSVMKFPASLNFEFDDRIFELPIIKEIRSFSLPAGLSTGLPEAGNKMGSNSFSVPRANTINDSHVTHVEEPVEKRRNSKDLNTNGPALISSNNQGSKKHYKGRTSLALNSGYYTKGPLTSKHFKQQKKKQVWRSSVPKLDPCCFRASSSLNASFSFDPFELEIQASSLRDRGHYPSLKQMMKQTTQDTRWTLIYPNRYSQ